MTRSEFLQQTLAALDGPRSDTYGDPLINHTRIAELWSTILSTPISVSQVYACMVAVKLSRLVQSPQHLDSLMDIAGYVALAAETCDEE